ncbi:leucine-rich repeat and calponin homology domain-containing protein 4 isoform X4 [Haemorhous mexicanus]|uniref:leucine-rich repeat and calponin homology domain-containing protein 4 isoform X4 n=1 Tax=Haemorhous mexicanus TaxID=30427 RepID=UPI0028BD91C9|nr:leucine-rich repeat and calponin homology domain-containing protein 4 isoform X4 [Haemorhous mexicanus]
MAAAAVGALPAESPPPLGRLPGGAGTERALEEAEASGTLSLAGRRLRAFPAAAARRWDLSDTTQADLSRNRFGEVPEAACRLVSLEGLSLHHNCLRSVPPAIANLQALAHLDLSRNQLSSLPACLCLLPLRVLNASNNRLARLPPNLGALRTLRQLDVGCNRLRALPPGLGQLRALRDLNVRRNQLAALPEELSELPLVRLDFSCNRVVAIPRCFRRLRHLQTLLADNNPLQFPPAQICLKGKVHIFKYLEAESAAHPVPTCPPDEPCPLRQRGGLDSGFHSVDSGSKRWSGNESTDESSEPSRQHRETRGGAAGDSDPEQLEEEPSPEEQQSLRGDTPEGSRTPPRRPPQSTAPLPDPDGAPGPPCSPPKPSACLSPSSSSSRSATKPAPPDPDQLIAEVRQSLEALLQLRLPEELGDSELLGRVAAWLRPWASSPSPRQTPPPCRRPGVPEVKPPHARRPPPRAALRPLLRPPHGAARRCPPRALWLLRDPQNPGEPPQSLGGAPRPRGNPQTPGGVPAFAPFLAPPLVLCLNAGETEAGKGEGLNP